MHACTHTNTQSHSLSLSFSLSLTHTHKTHQQLGGGLQPLPYYHSNGISHIWAQMKTLWAATEIFILPVNRGILIVSLRACRTLPPDWVNELQLEVLGASDKHFAILWITGSLHCEFNWCIYVAHGLPDFQILVNLHYFLIVHCEIQWKQMDQIWVKQCFQVNIFHCALPLTGPKTLENELNLCLTFIRSFYPFGFICNSWKADKKLESC